MPSPIIGLTGPTGAGKSEAAHIMRTMGGAIIDADEAARRVVESPDCLAALKDAFGADICAEGFLDRHELARRAFVDTAHTQLLNDITHPRILTQIRAQIRLSQAKGAPFVVLDAPLLYESGLDEECNAVFIVLADPELRLRRICARDGISEADARQRMAAQQSDEYYADGATAIFHNNGDMAALEKALHSAISGLRLEWRRYAR